MRLYAISFFSFAICLSLVVSLKWKHAVFAHISSKSESQVQTTRKRRHKNGSQWLVLNNILMLCESRIDTAWILRFSKSIMIYTESTLNLYIFFINIWHCILYKQAKLKSLKIIINKFRDFFLVTRVFLVSILHTGCEVQCLSQLQALFSMRVCTLVSACVAKQHA